MSVQVLTCIQFMQWGCDSVIHNLRLCMYVLARTCMQHKVRHIYTGTYMLLVGVFYPYPDHPELSGCITTLTVRNIDEVSMSQAVMSRLQTSLNRSAGLPVGLVPRHSLLHSISLGIRPSSIRVTCPNHRKRFWEIKQR